MLIIDPNDAPSDEITGMSLIIKCSKCDSVLIWELEPGSLAYGGYCGIVCGTCSSDIYIEPEHDKQIMVLHGIANGGALIIRRRNCTQQVINLEDRYVDN